MAKMAGNCTKKIKPPASCPCVFELSSPENQPNYSDSWGNTLGHIWAKHLRNLHLDRSCTLVEIGPGFSAKIGFGLAEMGYCGSLFLVEPNDAARRWAQRKYRQLLPMAQVKASRQTIGSVSLPIKRPVNGIVANHIVDDLLFSYFISDSERSRIFNQMRPGASCPENFRHIWHQILNIPGVCQELADRAVEDIVQLTENVPSDHLILNDYLSWHHYCCGLEDIYPIGVHLLEQLKERLAMTSRFHVELIRDEADDMCWLIAENLSGNLLENVNQAAKFRLTNRQHKE